MIDFFDNFYDDFYDEFYFSGELVPAARFVITFSPGEGTTGGLVATVTTGGLVVSKLERGITFDGLDDYATITNKINTTPDHVFTATLWFRTSSHAALRLFDQGPTSRLTLEVNATYVRSFATQSYVTFPTTIALETWYHLAFVFNDTQLTVYKNGVSLGTQACSQCELYGRISSAQKQRFMSSYDALSNFKAGKLSDVRFYNVAKTAPQIDAIFRHAEHVSDLDRVGLLSAWMLRGEAKTSHYDWSGNGKTLDISR